MAPSMFFHAAHGGHPGRRVVVEHRASSGGSTMTVGFKKLPMLLMRFTAGGAGAPRRPR